MEWNTDLINHLYAQWKVPTADFEELQRCIGVYISKALHFDYTPDESEFMTRLESRRHDRINVTPNGGVVPKKEFALEYNAYLKSWCGIVSKLTKNSPAFLKKFRLTPNIRIKYGLELEDNVGRGLDTALPHSDAWVEGPWGMNCHIPIFGDTNNNYLHFFKLKDESKFEDKFLDTSEVYTNMQWVLDYYEDDTIIPAKGCISISDYALLHGTKRNPNCKSRVSIDTTIFAGEHDVHPDRKGEYLDKIPKIGEDLFVSCERSERENYSEKKTVFSHYTSLKHVRLSEGSGL